MSTIMSIITNMNITMNMVMSTTIIMLMTPITNIPMSRAHRAP